MMNIFLKLENPNAKVEVYKGSTLLHTYHVPNNLRGTIWTVFELKGDTFTPINRFGYGAAEEAAKF